MFEELLYPQQPELAGMSGCSRPNDSCLLTKRDASRRYTASVQPVDLGAAAAAPGGSEPMATADYLPVEHGEEAKCAQMFGVIRKYEASRSINFQARCPAPEVTVALDERSRSVAVRDMR